jgi:hypothetical protein
MSTRPIEHGTPWLVPRAFLALCAPLFAQAGCGEPLGQTVRAAHDRIATLELPGEDRAWMRDQLQLIDAACLRGGEVEAAWRVESVLQRLDLVRTAQMRASYRGARTQR